MNKRSVTVRIQDLAISNRSKNALLRVKITTLNELEEKGCDAIAVTPKIHQELLNVLEHVDEIFCNFEARQALIAEVYAEVCDISINELNLSIRAYNGLKTMLVSTIGDLLSITESDLSNLENVGTKTRQEILDVIENILSQGKDYFENNSDKTQKISDNYRTIGKGYDYPVIDILMDKFYLKPLRMKTWFGITSQEIYYALEKRSPKCQDVWTGKQLSENECQILKTMIQKKAFEYRNENVICCCLDDRQSDLACIFIYENEIKCFFLKDLPEKLQQEFLFANCWKNIEHEISSESNGKIIKKNSAQERHIEELQQNIIHDNVIYIPTNSHIYRVLSNYCYTKGYVLNEYIQSLGFERTTERPAIFQDAQELDMQIRKNDGQLQLEEMIFANYPLIGSKILEHDDLEKLNENARIIIDTVLRNPRTKLTLHQKMQITIALINNAKRWKSEESGEFWKYITLQFGYRDDRRAVEKLLQSSLEDSMKKNNRLFLEEAKGRAFKTTAVIHALTTKKSWMALFDFLFDFYKNNLNWKIISGDPLLTVMIRSLQQKLQGDSSEDIELTISSHVYSFQEGIRKLVLFRPAFTCGLFEKLISKIDALVNSEIHVIESYEEQLCEEWFKNKIITIANTKRKERHVQSSQREVAIDYSRIHIKYILKNETEIQLVLPDIRLKSENINRAIVTVYYNGSKSFQQNLSWYGNELGKTLIGVSLPLPEITQIKETLDIQVTITCDDKEIYNSDDTLNRRFWFFYGENEQNAAQIKENNYTVVFPETIKLKTENIDITEIEDFKNIGLSAYFLELKDGYAISANEHLIVFDSENGADICVMTPSESSQLPHVDVNGQEYCFAYHDSVCNIILGNTNFIQQYYILLDGNRIDYSSLPVSCNGLEFTFHMPSEKDSCNLQVISITDERLVFDRSFFLINNASCKFNKEFYFDKSDYQFAEFKVVIDDFSEIATFEPEDEEVRIPFRNGELHILIPKIEIHETTGKWMDGTSPVWYIEEVPHNSLLKILKPPKTDVQFLIGERNILLDGEGLVTIGNVLHSFCGTGNYRFADIWINVSGVKEKRQYPLTRVSYKERFLRQPEVWSENNKLYWDHGGSFIGKSGRTFTLTLYNENEMVSEFILDDFTDFIELQDNMQIGNYRYEIDITSGSLFKKTREVIAEGDCVIGDQNLLRFMNRRIVINFITDELHEDVGRIPIRTIYIDQIEYIGMEETSEGYCPIYRGIMFTTGYRGERYEFSFDNHTNQRGVKKMMVNPVKILYIGDDTLSITDSDGDGLYYCHHNDTEYEVYELTDHEYTKYNKSKYALVDLYMYRTERI